MFSFCIKKRALIKLINRLFLNKFILIHFHHYQLFCQFFVQIAVIFLKAK